MKLPTLASHEVLMWVAGIFLLAIVYLVGLLVLARFERKRAERERLEQFDLWLERTPERSKRTPSATVPRIPQPPEDDDDDAPKTPAPVPLVRRKPDGPKKGEP